MKHSKIHDKDQAEESRCEEEKGKHGSQEHMQPAGNQPPARLPADIGWIPRPSCK